MTSLVVRFGREQLPRVGRVDRPVGTRHAEGDVVAVATQRELDVLVLALASADQLSVHRLAFVRFLAARVAALQRAEDDDEERDARHAHRHDDHRQTPARRHRQVLAPGVDERGGRRDAGAVREEREVGEAFRAVGGERSVAVRAVVCTRQTLGDNHRCLCRGGGGGGGGRGC